MHVDLLTLPSRRNAPTSEAAARHIRRTGRQRKHIRATARLVQLRPGCTSNELAHLGGRDSDHLRHLVARRLPECEKLGLVTRGEVRKCTISERSALTWWPAINPTTGEFVVLETR